MRIFHGNLLRFIHEPFSKRNRFKTEVDEGFVRHTQTVLPQKKAAHIQMVQSLCSDICDNAGALVVCPRGHTRDHVHPAQM